MFKMNKAWPATKTIITLAIRTTSSESIGSITPRHKPSNFQKRILVWTKKYKNITEVPEFVSQETMSRANSEARIKFSNVLMFLTVVGSAVAVYLGKEAAKRGESVQQQNLDWHKQYKEKKERAATAKEADI